VTSHERGLVGATFVGVLIGAVLAYVLALAVAAPVQQEARQAIYGRSDPPTRSVTLSQARHACKMAERTLRAVGERLQPTDTITYRWEPDDARHSPAD